MNSKQRFGEGAKVSVLDHGIGIVIEYQEYPDGEVEEFAPWEVDEPE